jgi:hypothetical protein
MRLTAGETFHLNGSLTLVQLTSSTARSMTHGIGYIGVPLSLKKEIRLKRYSLSRTSGSVSSLVPAKLTPRRFRGENLALGSGPKSGVYLSEPFTDAFHLVLFSESNNRRKMPALRSQLTVIAISLRKFLYLSTI